MSEMSEVRRDDLGGDTRMGDVRGDDGYGGVGGDTTRGDVQQGDAMRDVPGQAPLSTDQIANPGAAQSTTATGPAGGADMASGTDTTDSESTQLLDPQDREAMTRRWRDIQADFVDQPRKAMQDADALVAGLMQQMAQMFSQERSQLEPQWSRGDQVSTEDLRVSLQRYRAFFERLLSV